MAGRGKSDRTAEGVTAIINMMVDGSWRSATSPKVIAERFGVVESTALTWASEASRHITRAIGDPAEIRARWVAQLEAVHGEARENGELGHAIAAIGTAAKVTGIDKQGAPEQVDWRAHPDWIRAKAVILGALRRHPEALADVQAAMIEAEGAERKALPE